jgi:hypothetical protein
VRSVDVRGREVERDDVNVAVRGRAATLQKVSRPD